MYCFVALPITESARLRSCAYAKSTNRADKVYAMTESLPESYIKRMIMMAIMINVKLPMNCLELCRSDIKK